MRSAPRARCSVSETTGVRSCFVAAGVGSVQAGLSSRNVRFRQRREAERSVEKQETENEQKQRKSNTRAAATAAASDADKKGGIFFLTSLQSLYEEKVGTRSVPAIAGSSNRNGGRGGREQSTASPRHWYYYDDAQSRLFG